MVQPWQEYFETPLSETQTILHLTECQRILFSPTVTVAEALANVTEMPAEPRVQM